MSQDRGLQRVLIEQAAEHERQAHYELRRALAALQVAAQHTRLARGMTAAAGVLKKQGLR